VAEVVELEDAEVDTEVDAEAEVVVVVVAVPEDDALVLEVEDLVVDVVLFSAPGGGCGLFGGFLPPSVSVTVTVALETSVTVTRVMVHESSVTVLVTGGRVTVETIVLVTSPLGSGH